MALSVSANGVAVCNRFQRVTAVTETRTEIEETAGSRLYARQMPPVFNIMGDRDPTAGWTLTDRPTRRSRTLIP